MIPWYPCCGLLRTKTHGSHTDVSKPSPLAVARKQFLHSRVPSASPLNCLEQLHPNSTGLTWNSIEWHSDEEWLFSPDRVTGVESLLHISKLQLVSMAADGLQNCHKAFSGKRRTL